MRSTFFDEEQTRRRLADFILTAPRLSQGHECAEFEKEFSLYQERAHSVLVSNGSAANLGLIQALLNLGRLKKGDRVGISAVTWATNVMPLLQLGLTPVAIDCSIDHLNITSAELQKHIKNLSALFITNALGFCGDLDVIVALEIYQLQHQGQAFSLLFLQSVALSATLFMFPKGFNTLYS